MKVQKVRNTLFFFASICIGSLPIHAQVASIAENQSPSDVVSVAAPIEMESVETKDEDEISSEYEISSVTCNERPRKSLCASCGPTWTATADGLFLNRSTPADNVLLFNVGAPSQNLNASSFDFASRTGADLTLTRRLGACDSLEVRYFGIDQWDSSNSFLTTPGSLIQFNFAAPLFSDSGSLVNSRYGSELQNAEINLRRGYNDWFTLLAGFRYVELDETLSINLPAGPFPIDIRVDSRNRLYGGQLGVDAKLFDRGGPLTVSSLGKAGVYGNAAAQNGVISDSIVAISTGANVSQTSFVGELDFTGTYRWTNHLSLRSGYRMLWIDGAALATDQLATTSLLPPGFGQPTTVASSGDVFYHGAFSGLQYAW